MPDTYEDYANDMQKEINELMLILYGFKKDETNGSYECSLLIKLIMKLGSGMSDKLKSFFGNNTLIQKNILENWIDNLDVEKLDAFLLVTFVRTTYTSRMVLKNWIELRDKIKIKLDNENKDSKNILRGLF